MPYYTKPDYIKRISKIQSKQAREFIAAMLEGTKMPVLRSQEVIDTKAVTKVNTQTGADILQRAVQSANSLENVAPEWTSLSKEDMVKLPYFMIVSAELQVSAADREFYLFGIIGPGMDMVEKVPFGKGNIVQRDAIYQSILNTNKAVGPMHLDMVPTKSGNDMALFRDGKRDEFEDTEDVPF